MKYNFFGLKKKCDLGDGRACADVGIILRDRKNDCKKAFDFFQKGYDLKSGFSTWCLGNSYFNGIGVQQDEKKAFRLYNEALKLGYKDALPEIGYCLIEGIGTGKNYVKAFQIFKILAHKKDPDPNVLNSIGLCYKHGDGVKKDYRKALYYFKKASSMEHIGAMCNCAEFLINGWGTKKDYQLAIMLLYTALKVNKCMKYFDDIYFLLGILHNNGWGVRQDYKKAVRLYKESAKLGNMNSQYYLALCYHSGKGIRKNLPKALYWMKKAAESGDVRAKKAIEPKALIKAGFARVALTEDKQ